MTRLTLLALALALPACADTTPDSDVQISCAGEHAAELCVHAANAAAELNPHLSYWVGVRDPDVTGVTWRDAEQWQIVVRPVGYVVCAEPGRCSKPICGPDRNNSAYGVTSYRHRTINVGECLLDDPAQLAATVRHELGHALGYVGHTDDQHALLRTRAYERTPPPASYTDHDIELIASVRRGESNTITEALWID